MSGLVTRRNPVTSSVIERVTPTGLSKAREALSGAGGGGGVAAPEGWAYKWDAADLSGAGDGNVISADWGTEAPVSPFGSLVYRDTALDGNPAVEFDGSSYFRGSSTDAAIPQPYCIFIALQIPSGDTGVSAIEWEPKSPYTYIDHFTGSGRVAGTFQLGSPTTQNFPDGPHNDGLPHAFAAIASGGSSELSHVGGTSSALHVGVNAFGGPKDLILGGAFNSATPPTALQFLSMGALLGEILVYDATDLTNAGEILTSLNEYGLSKYPSLSA